MTASPTHQAWPLCCLLGAPTLPCLYLAPPLWLLPSFVPGLLLQLLRPLRLGPRPELEPQTQQPSYSSA